MTGSATQMRSWDGPAVLSYGLRPFFLIASLWAALAMGLWIGMLSGIITLPTAFDLVAWHAHEFLFGYLSAVISGFLLTAIPNWTGRLPIVGWPLALLTGLWSLGRIAIAISEKLSPLTAAILDLSMLLVLTFFLFREIESGKNWRNLIVLVLLSVIILGNAIFHWEAAQGENAASGYGLRVGLAGSLMMVAVIGGRIIPSFTRNWLFKKGETRLPVPFNRFDKLSLLSLLVAFAVWICASETLLSGVLMLFAGGLHFIRLMRWRGLQTGSEPLLWVLHLAYGFLVLGMLAMAVCSFAPEKFSPATAQHIWMAGALGLMTLAVMTRASLGHTGRALTAGTGTLLIYLCLILSVLSRVSVNILPFEQDQTYVFSTLCWIGAYAGFAVFYGPALLQREKVQPE